MSDEITTTEEGQEHPAQIAHDQEVASVRNVLRAAKEGVKTRALMEFGSIVAKATKEVDAPEESGETPPQADIQRAVEGSKALVPQRVEGVKDARSYLYDRLPERIRAHRNPKVDADMFRWFRAVMFNDRATLAEFAAIQRAQIVLDEGATTPVSGLSQGAGGPLIPLPLANIIDLLMQNAAIMRNRVRIFTSPAKTLRVPTSGIATAVMSAEGADRSGLASDGPTPGHVLLDKEKMTWDGSATEEFMEDTPFNVISWLTEAVADAFAVLEDTQICTTDGISPNFTQAINTGITVVPHADGTTNLLAYGDIVDLTLAVPKPYRNRGEFFAASGMIAIISKLADSTGRPLFVPSGVSGAPAVVGDGGPGPMGTIFGRPVWEVPLPADELLYGDPREYALLEGGAMNMRSSAEHGWSTDTVHFKATRRADGAQLQPEAFRRLDGILG